MRVHCSPHLTEHRRQLLLRGLAQHHEGVRLVVVAVVGSLCVLEPAHKWDVGYCQDLGGALCVAGSTEVAVLNAGFAGRQAMRPPAEEKKCTLGF